MAKFVYRMQNILDIKEKMESQAKIAYGIANTKLLEEQEELNRILLRKIRYEKEARSLVEGTIDIQKIRDCKKAIDTMKSLQRTQMMNVQKAERNLEIARIRLNEVMIERKTHETLRDNAFEEFKQDIQNTESKEIDELVSYTYHDSAADASL